MKSFWRIKPQDVPGVSRPVGVATLLLGGVLFVGGIPALAIASQTVVDANAAADSLPLNLQTLPLPESTRILAADGTPIADLYQQNRVEVTIDQISKPMQEAILAIEDSRFYEHNGIDFRGTVRAYVTNQISGGVVQGGSTLTQQYVKNSLVLSAKTPEEAAAAKAKTITRKLREMRYSLAIERTNSKEEILSGYLNISYFGAGAHGVEAAAKRYFSKSAIGVPSEARIRVLSGNGKVCKFKGKESAAAFASTIVWEAIASAGIPPTKSTPPKRRVAIPTKRPTPARS